MAHKMIWLLAILLVSAVGVPAPAAATEWVFTETSTSRPDIFASATMILDNAAGLSVSRGSFGDPATDPATSNLLGTGIDALFISVPGDSTTLDDFVAADPFNNNLPNWFVSLSSAPSGVPTGEIYFNNIEGNTTFDFVFGGTTSSIFGTPPDTISMGSDPYACVLDYPAGSFLDCTVTGTWALVGSIPEPASIGLLAPGVLGLAALRRRRTLAPGADLP
jgi:hypothetical protein